MLSTCTYTDVHVCQGAPTKLLKFISHTMYFYILKEKLPMYQTRINLRVSLCMCVVWGVGRRVCVVCGYVGGLVLGGKSIKWNYKT